MAKFQVGDIVEGVPNIHTYFIGDGLMMQGKVLKVNPINDTISLLVLHHENPIYQGLIFVHVKSVYFELVPKKEDTVVKRKIEREKITICPICEYPNLLESEEEGILYVCSYCGITIHEK